MTAATQLQSIVDLANTKKVEAVNAARVARRARISVGLIGLREYAPEIISWEVRREGPSWEGAEERVAVLNGVTEDGGPLSAATKLGDITAQEVWDHYVDGNADEVFESSLIRASFSIEKGFAVVRGMVSRSVQQANPGVLGDIIEMWPLHKPDHNIKPAGWTPEAFNAPEPLKR